MGECWSEQGQLVKRAVDRGHNLLTGFKRHLLTYLQLQYATAS